jgi:hypothetical protein
MNFKKLYSGFLFYFRVWDFELVGVWQPERDNLDSQF